MTDHVDDLAAAIHEARGRSLAMKISPYQRNQPIASDCNPEECERRQVLEIVAWDQKPMPDERLQARFDTGNLWEREGIAELLHLGFEVVEQQVPFELRSKYGTLVLRGKIDGKIRWKDRVIPFEIKSLHPNVYERIGNWRDFQKMRFFKKYPTQMQSYLLGHGEDAGFFLLTDCLGHWKAITMELDYEWAERIWKRAEDVVEWCIEYGHTGELPSYTRDGGECQDCWAYGRVCNPPVQDSGEGPVILTDEDLLFKLEERDRLKPTAKLWADIDKEIKAYFKDRYTHVIVPPFEIKVERGEKRTVVKIDRIGSED